MQDVMVAKKGRINPTLCRHSQHQKILQCFKNSVWTITIRLQSSTNFWWIQHYQRPSWIKRLVGKYFSNLLNLPSTIGPAAINQIPQQPIMDELDALDEIKKAISQWNTNRASGKDEIPAEIYKAASPNTLESFHHVLKSIWDEE